MKKNIFILITILFTFFIILGLYLFEKGDTIPNIIESKVITTIENPINEALSYRYKTLCKDFPQELVKNNDSLIGLPIKNSNYGEEIRDGKLKGYCYIELIDNEGFLKDKKRTSQFLITIIDLEKYETGK